MDHEVSTSTGVWSQYEFVFETVTGKDDSLRAVICEVFNGERTIDNIIIFNKSQIINIAKNLVEEYHQRAWSKDTFKIFTPDGYRLIELESKIETEKLRKIFREIIKEYV